MKEPKGPETVNASKTDAPKPDAPKRKRVSHPISLYTKEPESGVLVPLDAALGVTFEDVGEVRRFLSAKDFIGTVEMVRVLGPLTRETMARAVFK